MPPQNAAAPSLHINACSPACTITWPALGLFSAQTLMQRALIKASGAKKEKLAGDGKLQACQLSTPSHTNLS
eukprot:scaffold581995_cov29-Prasinocladus_malaysianus.AAC.1